MARIKIFPPSRPFERAKSKSPPITAKPPWSASIELGASNGQAIVKKPGGEWELVRWAQGVGASSIGGAEAIPAMTAVRKKGQPKEVLHGHAAVRARKRNPGDWEIFAYPKLVFTDEGSTPDVQRTLDLQTEKATALGMTSKEIAIAFFKHMVSEVIGGRDEDFEIEINISDRWPNRNVQELMVSLQSLGFNAEFENVDECFCTIIGRISSLTGSELAEGVYVVIDCGHSGMNVGFAEVTAGPKYKVHRWKDYPAGAGEINMAVEDAVRSINRTNGAKSAEANVWEVSECIDEYFKPEPGAAISPRCGLSEEEWDRVIGHAELALRSLDRRRPDFARSTLEDARDLANRLAGDGGFHVLLTGRGSRSPPSLKAFRDLVIQEFPTATLHEDRQTNITSVLAGLACIADKPEILLAKEVPVSLWLRSDPDESTNGKENNTVVRICTQGQDKNDATNLRDRKSASHPIHFELQATDDEPPLLDLSVFGTPAEVFDEDIIEGWNSENFAYTDVDKVTEFGRFEQQLPRSTVKPGKRVCHVYLYVEVSRLSVELYAIFARDGRAVKPLEKTSFDEALQNGKLSTKWKKYRNVSLDVVRLKQAARPESLSTNALGPPASKSHQLEAGTTEEPSTTGSQQSEPTSSRNSSIVRSQQDEATIESDVSLPHASATQVIEIADDQRNQKRTASFSERDRTKRRKKSDLAAVKRKKTPQKSRSHKHGVEDDKTESEMEM